MTRKQRQQQCNTDKRRNNSSSDVNDALLIEARMIEMYGFNDKDSAHAWNTRLKMQGLGVKDNFVRTKYFCSKCGWRMFARNRIYFCSNWTICKRQCAGDAIKRGRSKAHLARQASLQRARTIADPDSGL